MSEELDDLTLVYMYGFKNGKDSLKDEIERLLLIEQGAAEPCDTCGWRMRFPHEECRNCENAKLRDEIERLRAALWDQLNDCINFDGGKLTDSIMARSSAALAGEASDDAAT